MASKLTLADLDTMARSPEHARVAIVPPRSDAAPRDASDPLFRPANAMTVDVEEYFQVSAFEPYVKRTAWSLYASRIEPQLERILEMFDTAGIQGTFFTLGWIAERYPEMVRRIVAAGHELASHGWEHRMVTTQRPADFAADVRRAKLFLEDLSGSAVSGYRAPSYSINGKNNRLAHAALRDADYLYSSSVAPIEHDLYGWPEASPLPFQVADNALLEVPISTIGVGPRRIACGGGGWFRLYPYALSRHFVQRLNARGTRYLFYFHPWEIDAEQPRTPNIDRKTRFRHYTNLQRTQGRIERLLQDFRWDRMDRVFAVEIAGVAAQRAPAPAADIAVARRAASF